MTVERRSIEKLAPVHRKRLLADLRLMELRVGLLINSGAPKLREGLQRVASGYVPAHAA